MRVDAAINYYGKPYHTMVTIGSLLEHSAEHVDRIFLIKEAQQPEGGDLIVDLLAAHDWNVEVFVPRYYHGWGMYRPKPFGMRRKQFRWSIRYQYALERSDKHYVFLTHNDVLFQGDVVGPMLAAIQAGGHAGVGDLGACWKCPAKAAGLCDKRPGGLHMTYDEAVALYLAYPSEEREHDHSRLDRTNPVPFPECRLNEWLALIDREAYVRETRPKGTTELLGSYALGDVGIEWFRSMMHKGYTFEQYYGPWWHAWTHTRGGGHEALSDRALYDQQESVAREYYQTHYADTRGRPSGVPDAAAAPAQE